MNGTPLREIRPVVIPAQFFVWGPVVSAFLSIFPGFFAFVISNMIGFARGFHDDPLEVAGRGLVLTYGLIAYALSFVVCMIVLGTKAFAAPTRTTYTIYPDRVEYDDGLWTRRRRTLILEQVMDVQMTESVLQRARGAGTITLVTRQLVSGNDGKLSPREIALKNVPEPGEVYELLRRAGTGEKGR